MAQAAQAGNFAVSTEEAPQPVSISYPIAFAHRAVVILLLIIGMNWLMRHVRLDDSLIYARYIQHAIDGRGLVFNVGESVNALTSILYTWLILAVGAIVRQHVWLIAALLSNVFLLAAALIAEQKVPLAGIFLAATPLFYFCTGMETSLFLFVLALCVRAYAAGSIEWLPLLCVLAALTRLEGGAVTLIVVWRLWSTRRMPSWKAFILPALLILAYFAFNLYFYRILLPHSASAKIGQGMSGYWGRWPTAFLRVPQPAIAPIGGSWIYFVVLALLTWYAGKDPRLSRWNQVAFPLLSIFAAFYVLFNIPGYHWYYAPFIYFFTIYVVRLIPERGTGLRVAILFVSLMVLASAAYLRDTARGTQSYIATGKWLNQNTKPNAHIAAVETGTLGWYCDRHITDIVGLTTPANAAYTEHRDFNSWFAERPDYIVVHPGNPFPWERIALASPEYEMLPVHFEAVSVLHKKPLIQR